MAQPYGRAHATPASASQGHTQLARVAGQKVPRAALARVAPTRVASCPGSAQWVQAVGKAPRHPHPEKLGPRRSTSPLEPAVGGLSQSATGTGCPVYQGHQHARAWHPQAGSAKGLRATGLAAPRILTALWVLASGWGGSGTAYARQVLGAVLPFSPIGPRCRKDRDSQVS